MRIVTKMHLPRRTFLRGAGATLALPLLDAMVPAFAPVSHAATMRVPRLGIVYVPNGMIMQSWTPASTGTGFDLPPILGPLAPFKEQLVVVTGLRNHPAFPAEGEGSGDHVRAGATFLTAVHPKKTEGPDIRAGVSMDQIAAQVLGKDTQLASLELCIDATELIGACEAGYSCAYSNTLCWRDATTPLPMENLPRAVFERLFGDSDNTSQSVRLERIRQDRSVLDSLLQELARFQKRVGTGDRAKLEQYLEAIRTLERRIRKAEEQSAKELPTVDRPSGGIPDTWAEHARMMFDLQVLAFQVDITRVITFMMSREVSPRTYPEIGIPDPHHGLSHHGNNPAQIAKLVKINTLHMEQFAYFLDKLRATPDGDTTLLDNVSLLYGGGISDSNQHLHTDLPILVAGGGAGQIRGGRHLKVQTDTPLANLQLTLLHQAGVTLPSLGDSTGGIDGLSA